MVCAQINLVTSLFFLISHHRRERGPAKKEKVNFQLESEVIRNLIPSNRVIRTRAKTPLLQTALYM